VADRSQDVTSQLTAHWDGPEAGLLNLGRIGSRELGYLSVAEVGDDVPFPIRRVYWTYYTPHDVERGHHAHRDLEQVLVAVSGIIQVTTENVLGGVRTFVLDDPGKGLHMPKLHWRTLKFSHSAVLLSLASMEYDPDEYIRSYDEFRALKARYRTAD
jgi:hypothetical protein